MNTPDYESIWRQSLIRVTDKFSLPPSVLRVDDAIIGPLGNFSVSTGKAKAKKTFNVSALVASALSGGQVLEYRACFPDSKRNILYFDTEQSPYHCQLVMQRILRLAELPLDQEARPLEVQPPQSHRRPESTPRDYPPCYLQHTGRGLGCHRWHPRPDARYQQLHRGDTPCGRLDEVDWRAQHPPAHRVAPQQRRRQRPRAYRHGTK